MYTLQNIKDIYYARLAMNSAETRGFDQYLRETFIQIYDADLNYLGYERRTS